MIDNKDLTIVIPCKNEKDNIIKTLDSIYQQRYIKNLDVIISDNSDDNITRNLILNNINKYKDKINILIIKGGYPSEARHNGAKLVDSKYILFLDADVELISKNILYGVYYEIKTKKIDLLTVNFETDKGYNYIYKIFYIFQKLGLLLNTVFAVGGFQLWNTYTYKKIGGYKSELIFAEDYWMSSKVRKNKFLLYNKYTVYTSARRFKNKGIYYMLKLMILSYFNRNNIDFFKKDHNYWK